MVTLIRRSKISLLKPLPIAWHIFPQRYLVEAVRVLEQEPNGTSVDAINVIWVASGDTNVVNEVREMSSAYFPNVLSEDVVYVAGGVPGGVHIEKVSTHSNEQVRTHGSLETIEPLL